MIFWLGIFYRMRQIKKSFRIFVILFIVIR